MATLYPELIATASASDGVSTNDRQLVIEYLLKNVDGNDMADMLRNALEDDRIPRKGEENQHFDGYVVTNKTARIEGASKRNVRVTVTWGPNVVTSGGGSGGITFDPGLVDVDQQVPSETGVARVTVGSSVVGVTTNIGAGGLPITVEYKGISQSSSVEYNVPVSVRRFERLEPFNPEAKNLLYTGKVNIDEWLGSPPDTYLCRGITGEPVALENGTLAWRVAYEFEASPEGNWTKRIVYVDPETGEIPPDAIDLGYGSGNPGTGVAYVEIYKRINFSLLNLTMPI